jgi:hypothetical protein
LEESKIKDESFRREAELNNSKISGKIDQSKIVDENAENILNNSKVNLATESKNPNESQILEEKKEG